MDNEEIVAELLIEEVDSFSAYPELEKLKAANETLREQGKDWLFDKLEDICAAINLQLAPAPNAATEAPPTPQLQIGSQPWQFQIENNVMVGERLGIRYREQTLIVEAGWPRLPEHGIVPDLGLARARVSHSPNVMIDTHLIAELSLRRERDSEAVTWYLLKDRKVVETVREEQLHEYLQQCLNLPCRTNQV